VAWNKHDLLTYALGVGTKNDEFPFIYLFIMSVNLAHFPETKDSDEAQAKDRERRVRFFYSFKIY
jgi:hypothetical protein